LVQDLLNSFNLRQLDYSNIVSGYFVDSEAQSIEVNNQRIAEYGKLKPNIASNFDIDTMELKQDVWIADIDINQVISLSRNSLPSYQAIPKYPSMERDISFLIEHGISHTKIIEGIKTASNGHISDVNLIDEYKGNQIKDGFHSLTYKIVFNNPQKTLTDVEVDSEFDLIVKKLKSLWDIQLR